MANFAKAQLLKYGWKEGKGLGKNENGLTEALKPTLKFDNAGVGFDETNTDLWWETLYDKAAKNIKVELHDNEVSLSTINDSNMIDAWNTVSYKKNKKFEQQKYGNFLKTSTLLNGHLIQDTSIEKEEKNENGKDSVCIPMIDKQLYKTCDSKTVHKAAKHDLKLNGEFERIVQDKIFLDVNIGNVSQLDTSPIKKNTMTYRKADKELDTEDSEENPEENQEMVDDQNTYQYEDFVFRSKNAKKHQKKKLNKLTQQFSICSLKKNKDSMYHSLYDKELTRFKKEKELQLDIKSKKCSEKKRRKRKKSIQRIAYNILHKAILDLQDKLKNTTEDVYLSKSEKSSLKQQMYQNQISPISKIVSELSNLNKANENIYQIMLPIDKEKRNINIEQEIQEQKVTKWKYYGKLQKGSIKDIGKRDVETSTEKFCSLYYTKLDKSSKIYKSIYKYLPMNSTELQITNPDDKLHNKDKKIKKKQKRVKKQLEKVINPVNFCTDDLNTVIKKLTTVDLTEKVSANAFKKKLTQTHLTPV